ncbi:uncharacterized protein [Dermacentor andersoni]|uniref:uncharacterized protein n=1 Tax=Dermacentor andersoni TaxID=34620 RepID=UPI002416644F|nr:uncharacterized protein LOC129385542 [Dermacentor andersoni]
MTTEAPLKNIKLTCTFGRSGVLETQLPPDKMCDYIFYTHIYYNVRLKKIRPIYGAFAITAFINAVGSYSTTTFGYSFALSLMPAFPPDHKDALKEVLESQFGYGFQHFAALDVDVRDYPSAKSGGLQYLKASTSQQLFAVYICM